MSCNQNNAPVTDEVKHVDIPAFFRNEIQVLDKSGSQLIKIMNLSGNEETLLVSQPDWKAELKLFLEPDLNNKAIRSWLRVDTMKAAGEEVLIYTSLDSASKFRHGYFRIVNDIPDSVSMHLFSTSLYGTERQQLDYGSGSGYSISFLSNPIAGKGVEMKIQGLIQAK